jgi:hypothetical protein
VRVQLRAMGCERFDLGIRREAGEMILREGQGAIEIEETIKWLRHGNGNGAHAGRPFSSRKRAEKAESRVSRLECRYSKKSAGYCSELYCENLPTWPYRHAQQVTEA